MGLKLPTPEFRVPIAIIPRFYCFFAITILKKSQFIMKIEGYLWASCLNSHISLDQLVGSKSKVGDGKNQYSPSPY